MWVVCNRLQKESVIYVRTNHLLRSALNYAVALSDTDRVGAFVFAIRYGASRGVMLRVIGGMSD